MLNLHRDKKVVCELGKNGKILVNHRPDCNIVEVGGIEKLSL